VSNVARPLPYTYRELVLMPEDGKRHELIDGDLFVTPAPATYHQTVSRRLQHELMTQLEDNGLASIFDAPVDVLFDETNVVEPDLVIVSVEHAGIITERAIEGVPDIVVEILSPSTKERDRHWKFRLYQRFLVPEYWIVDPDLGSLEAHMLVEGGYGLRARYNYQSTLDCPLFPTLSVDLKRVFQRIPR
jgi:Uma2 family endonuclease